MQSTVTNVDNIIERSKRNKEQREVIKYNRIMENTSYCAIITDCGYYEANKIKLEVTFFSEKGGVEKEFFFNLKGNSSYYLDNILDMLEVDSSNLAELIGKCAKAMIKRTGGYETFIVIQSLGEEELRTEISQEEVSEERETKEIIRPTRKANASKRTHKVTPAKRPSEIRAKATEEELEEDEDIDFDEEE